VTDAAIVFLAGLAVGMVGGAVWGWAIEMLEIWREER